MTPDEYVVDGLGDFRHVAGNAFTTRAARRVVGVLLDARGMRPVLRIGAVAGQAKPVAGLAHDTWIVRAVRIVATEARDAARVHKAGDEIIALHAVLVRRSIGEVRKRGFPKLVLLEPPKIRQVQADVEADGPVVVFTLDRVSRRPTLRVALDAGVARVNIVEAGRVEDGGANREPNGRCPDHGTFHSRRSIR